ncbi:MAG: winged helix-turn-helix domain-containing protein [Pyrinomonadaceae bacterium]
MKQDVNKPKAGFYEFGEFRLFPSERLLFQKNEIVSLPPKVFEVLVILVEKGGYLIEKEELLEIVWADTNVEASTLARTVSRLRKALGEDAENKYIETVSKSGYRFTAPVNFLEGRVEPAEDGAAGEGEKKAGIKDRPFPGSQTRDSFGKRGWILVSGIFFILLLALAFYWRSRVAERPGVGGIRSVAVLPFRMIGETEEDRALKVGMADALITKFSNLKQIIVRPTSSILRYEGQIADPVKVAGELQVDAVLEGIIQKDGERLRLTVQLLSSEDGKPLWAGKFDARSTDLFMLQDNISTQVAQSLALELTGSEEKRFNKHYTENPEAYQAYLKGRYFWNKRNPADLKTALEYFEKAVETDPEYALAYTGIADCYQLLGEYRVMPAGTGFGRARTAAQKALEIDENLAEAHASLGYTLAFYDWKFTEAEREFKKAIELNPNYATARQWYGEFLMARGRFEAAKKEVFKAQELDPVSPIIGTNVVGFYYTTREYDRALEAAGRTIELAPDFAWVYAFQSLAFHQKGMDREAIDAWLKSTEKLGGKTPEQLEKLKEAARQGGWKGFWREWLEQMKAAPEFFLAWDFAACYVFLGEDQVALDWLEKSFEHRDRWVINLKYNPQFDPVRSDPRFVDLVRRIGN